MKRAMQSKFTVLKPNIYIVWYNKCDSIFDKIGMKKYPQNIFSCSVFLKATLIEINGKFA